jgi:hypothetical protein
MSHRNHEKSTPAAGVRAGADVDLGRTRRTFLFAREQVASHSHSRIRGYPAIGEIRRRANGSSTTQGG